MKTLVSIRVALTVCIALSLVSLGASVFASPGTWETCSACPEVPEVGIVGDTITVGVAGDAEFDSQNTAVHGASMALPPAQAYRVTFNYDLYTWDSYNAPGTPNPPWWGGTGYWDSFSVSISQSQYWNLSLTDPLDGDPLALGFLWGGASYGDGFLETTSGSTVVMIPASEASMNYLNVVLDTATSPDANHSYPSWGEFEIIRVELVVDVDIKPQSYPNCFNINGRGVVPVAILGTEAFDVTQVDVTTLDFGGLDVRVKGNGIPQCSVEDVSGDFTHPEGAPDGYPDLVCQFVDDAATWSPGNDMAEITGALSDGTLFEGEDSICVVPE